MRVFYDVDQQTWSDPEDVIVVDVPSEEWDYDAWITNNFDMHKQEWWASVISLAEVWQCAEQFVDSDPETAETIQQFMRYVRDKVG